MSVIGTLVAVVKANTAPFEKGMKKSSAAMGGVQKGAAKTGTAVDGMARKSNKAARQTGSSMAAMAGKMAAVAAVALVVKRALKAIIDVHEGLNKSMARSLAIMGDVSDAMKGEMREAAIDVARTTNFSAKEAGEAYFFLASAGMDAAQSLEALPAVAEFATAGNFDLATATDLVTDAQSALGLASKDSAENLKSMVRVSDVLVKANTVANASVQQFSEALTNGAGVALKQVNKDIEEGVAVLAAFAQQGIKGSEAGTALSIVMRDLQSKAIKNKDIFKKAGIAVFDSSGKMRNMADIIENLETKLGGLSDEQLKQTLLMLGFSDKSIKYVASVIGMSDSIRGYEKSLRDANGITKEVADASLTDMEKAMNKLKGAWTSFADRIGKVIIPILVKLVEVLAFVIEKLDQTIELFGKAAEIGVFGVAGIAATGGGGEEFEKSAKAGTAAMDKKTKAVEKNTKAVAANKDILALLATAEGDGNAKTAKASRPKNARISSRPAALSGAAAINAFMLSGHDPVKDLMVKRHKEQLQKLDEIKIAVRGNGAKVGVF